MWSVPKPKALAGREGCALTEAPAAADRWADVELHEQLQHGHASEIEHLRRQNALLLRRLTRMQMRFTSYLFDLRGRHLLKCCFQALRSHRELKSPQRKPARMACSSRLEELELEEQLEQQAYSSESKLRKSRIACARYLLRVRHAGIMRLVLIAFRAHAAQETALRHSFAASFIARRLVGRDVLGIVLRVWRQHVVQQIRAREMHAQLSSVVHERLQAAEGHYAALLESQRISSQQQLASIRCRLADAAVSASHRATLASCWRIMRLHTANSKMVRERCSWRKVLSEYADEKARLRLAMTVEKVSGMDDVRNV